MPPSTSDSDPAPTTRSTRETGRVFEARAASFLESRGLQIVARNVELGGAELDLIARGDEDGDPLVVFVEVRGRASDQRGDPLETVDARKQRQIIRGATAWLVREGLWEKVAVRFDVVGVVGNDEAPEIQWIAGAFDRDG